MYSISVIGEKTSVFGFAALGFDVRFADTKEEAENALREAVKDNAGVVYITERTAALIPEAILALRDEVTPAVILIPGLSGNTGEGLRQVEESVEKAVGTKLA